MWPNNPLNAPQKDKRLTIAGKNSTRYKMQLLVDFDTLEILSVVCCKGRLHDLRILKESWVAICPSTGQLSDSGYQGIRKLYPGSDIPKIDRKENRWALLPSDVTRSYQKDAFELNTSIGIVKSSESPKRHIEGNTRTLREAGMWSVPLSTRDIRRPAWRWILSAVNSET